MTLPPAPEAFAAVVDALGAQQSECLFVDETIANVLAAEWGKESAYSWIKSRMFGPGFESPDALQLELFDEWFGGKEIDAGDSAQHSMALIETTTRELNNQIVEITGMVLSVALPRS